MYEAPLRHCDGDIVPNRYIVFLARGNSLEQHKRVLGDDVDLDSAITNIFDSDPGQIHYGAELHTGALAAVRADPGVDFVECNRWVYGAAGT